MQTLNLTPTRTFGKRNRTDMNKYRVSAPEARTFNGKVYASKAECMYAQELALRLRAGELAEVVEQPRLWLGVVENIYVPDFLIIPFGDAMPYYIDVKGVETAAFKKNKKLWAKYGRLQLRIVKRSGNGFKTTETITPTGER